MESGVNFRNTKIDTKSVLYKYIAIGFLEDFISSNSVIKTICFFVVFIICTKREW